MQNQRDKAKFYIAEHDELAKTFGIEVVAAEQGYGKAVMPLENKHKNSSGIAHGGAIFSLADVALALASNSDGHLALGVNSSISFMNPGKVGPLTAEARELSKSYRLAHYEITVRDGESKILAVMQATTYKKNVPFPPESEAV